MSASVVKWSAAGVDSVTVIPAQQASGNATSAEIKFIWSLPVSLHASSAYMSPRIENLEAGLVGSGSWGLQYAPNGWGKGFQVGLHYSGLNVAHLAPTVAWSVAVVSPLHTRLSNPLQMRSTNEWQFTQKGDGSHRPGFRLDKKERLESIEVTVILADRNFGGPPAAPVVTFPVPLPELPAVPSEENLVTGAQKMGDNLRQCYLDGRYTDAVLVADDHKIRVHRVALTAHSHVFTTMFSNDDQSSQPSVYEVTDVHYDALKVFIDTLYGLDVDERLVTCAEGVFDVANRFECLELKERCIGVMKRTVALENAFDRFVLAKENELGDLAAAMCAFVREHYEEFITNDGMDKVYQRKGVSQHRKDFLLLSSPREGKKKRSAAAAEL